MGVTARKHGPLAPKPPHTPAQSGYVSGEVMPGLLLDPKLTLATGRNRPEVVGSWFADASLPLVKYI